METYITKEGQSIWDLSNLLYGNTSNVVKLANDNPSLVNVTKTIPAGTVVLYDKTQGNDVADFFNNKNITPSTSTQTPGQGSGFTGGFDYDGLN